ncbi:MAG: KaiC domain-containing protein [Halodesulfurarchaeum sp.]
MAEDASADDEDWFERALQEDEEGTGGSDDERGMDADAATTEGDEDDESPGDTDEASGDGEPMSGGSAEASDAEEPPSSANTTDVSDLESAFDVDEGDEPNAVSDQAEAFDQSPSFDVDQGDQEQFGFDLGGDSAGGFEAEEYRTERDRIDVGIDGLDEMIQGGVPDRSLIVTIGGAGTGKTTFGLQFLDQALENDERGVFISLEESRERILQTAREKGWEFETAEAAGDLAVIDLDPVDMANSLTSIRTELPRLVEEFGASRLVLDSVSLLEMMYDKQATRRTEIYDFARSLKEAGVTTMVTSEADEDNPYASRYGIIEYLTDAVFVLRYVRPDDFRETRLAIEIQKIRDANHSRETKPYEITNTGISVYRQANIF